MKYTTPKELLDFGLIFEINRSILHPLGLAIAITIDDATGETTFSNDVWDCRDDSEGWIFGKEAFEEGVEKFKAFMEKTGQATINERFKLLGFSKQTTGEQGESGEDDG